MRPPLLKNCFPLNSLRSLWNSKFLAPNQVSAGRDDEVVFETNPQPAKLRGQIIEAFIDATCTAPTRVRATAPFTAPGPTAFLEPRKGFVLNLFNFQIQYEMLDQFGGSIKGESAWDGCVPVCRENMASVLQSPLPPVNAHIRTHLKHTPNWKPKRSGTINDRIFLHFGLLGSPVAVSHAGGVLGASAAWLFFRVVISVFATKVRRLRNLVGRRSEPVLVAHALSGIPVRHGKCPRGLGERARDCGARDRLA